MRWLIALLLLWPFAAESEIGSVTELSGTAVIKRGKDTILIVRGNAVESNDKIETKNGKVKITFNDGTTASITESSSLVIDDFVYDPKTAMGKLAAKVTSGTVRYTSGAIAHNNPNAVNIKTPTAAIAVRGTDFVMSVNEIGSSMVILMPSCDGEQCTSGRIDVNTDHGSVTMDRPYQATMVENSNTPPSQPIVVNLSNSTIGNDLQISPPKTSGGMSIAHAAKAAAEKTGDAKKSSGSSIEAKESMSEEQTSNNEKQNQTRQSLQASSSSENSVIDTIVVDTTKLGITVSDSTSGNPNVSRVFKDSSETQVIGWRYESLSANVGNYINVQVPNDSKSLLIVTQDRILDAYNFNTQSTKAYGLIVINQNSK